MKSADLLLDAFGRIREEVHAAANGLSVDQLAYRPDANANSIGWLVWHLTRVQDHHVADAAGNAQVWVTDGWVRRFDLPFDDFATGHGHGSNEVGVVRASSDLLLGYHDAVHEKTCAYVEHVTDPDLGRVVDESWDPPVTLGVRLISVISDDLQHAGQASYVRGLLERIT